MANKQRDNVNTKGRGLRAGARVPVRGGTPGSAATGLFGKSVAGKPPAAHTPRRNKK